MKSCTFIPDDKAATRTWTYEAAYLLDCGDTGAAAGGGEALINVALESGSSSDLTPGLQTSPKQRFLVRRTGPLIKVPMGHRVTTRPIGQLGTVPRFSFLAVCLFDTWAFTG